MAGRIHRMNARQAETVLLRNGFRLVSQRGSHRKWRHDGMRLQVIVPEHRGHDLPLGTLRSIMQAAQIPEIQWRNP
jgi:predicted RNA binding protein YcfA (HicA-like mRNA interferase family)